MLASPEFKRRSVIDEQIKRAALASTPLNVAILPASSLTSIASLPVHDQNVELVATVKANVSSMVDLYYTTRPTGCSTDALPIDLHHALHSRSVATRLQESRSYCVSGT